MDEEALKRLAEKVDLVLKERRDHYLGLISGLLKFQNVSGGKTDEEQERFRKETAACLEYLGAEARRLGMDFRVYGGRAAVAELKGARPGAEAVGVALHIDVVPAGDGWERPAFGGEVADGEIWGRGAQDDKGPTAMALAAVDALLRAHVEPAGAIRLLVGTQEETGDWSDVDLLIEKGEAPKAVMVPDGAYPIVNGEKGMITVELKGEWPTPTAGAAGLRLLSLKSGERCNMVPELATARFSAPSAEAGTAERRLEKAAGKVAESEAEARIEVVRDEGAAAETVGFTVTCHGRSSHGARPEGGHNAAIDALDFLLELGDASPAMGAYAEFLSKRARLLDASGFGLALRHDHLKHTTVNLGILEVGPEGGRAELNIRFPIGLTAEAVAEKLRAQAAELAGATDALETTAEIKGKTYEPLFVSPEEHGLFLNALERAYEAGTGRKSQLASIAGTTYAKAYPLAVAFGPVDEAAGDLELAHKANERVTVERYLENIKVYALALALLTEGE